jgi:hypothetical protein
MAQPDITSTQIDTGTNIDDIVKLEGIGSPAFASLPVVDGSQVLNIDASFLNGSVTGTNIGDIVQLEGVGSPDVAGLPAVDGSQVLDLDASNITSGTLDATLLEDVPGSPAVAGSYTTANITVDSKGRVTTAESGIAAGITHFELQTADSGSPLQTVFNTTVDTISNYAEANVAKLQIFVNGILQLENLPGSPVSNAYSVTGANQITADVMIYAL